MKKKFPSSYKFVLALLMLGLLFTGIITKNNQEKILIGRLHQLLVSVTDLRISQLKNWFNSINFEGSFISKNRLIEDEFKLFIKDKRTNKDDIIRRG